MLRKGQCDEGLRLAEEAQAIRKRLLPPSHPEVAASLNATGWAHEYGGNFELARRYYEQVIIVIAIALEQCVGSSDVEDEMHYGEPLICERLPGDRRLHRTRRRQRGRGQAVLARL